MIIAVVGPTGVGKSKMAIELAKKYNGIIVNCDCYQVYKDMNIGTAKVSKEEQEGIKHYLLDFVDVNTNYTVYDYQMDARKIIEENKGKTIILVGGTGLYLKSVLYDYKFSKEDTNDTYDNLTNEELLTLCKKKDINCNIHVNNRKRLIRYLNRKEEPSKAEPLYDFILIGLTTNRDNLYNIVNNRVEEMFKKGLVKEVKNLYDKNIHTKAMDAIGYKELYKYFDKDISLDGAKELIKKNTRHYIKRQYTWFNNQMNVKWFNTNYEDFNKTVKEVSDYIDSKNLS